MLRNLAAETFYGGFTASKIWRLIRRAIIFAADFRQTSIRRRIRRSAAAEGSMTTNANYTVFHKIGTPLYFSITLSNVDRFEWKLHHCIL